MAKLTRVDNNTVSYSGLTEELPVTPADYEELPDYSVKVVLSDGTIAIFREMTGADLKLAAKLRKSGNDEMDITMRLASALCIQWGNEEAQTGGAVVPAQIEKLRARDVLKISEAIASFLQTEEE